MAADGGDGLGQNHDARGHHLLQWRPCRGGVVAPSPPLGLAGLHLPAVCPRRLTTTPPTQAAHSTRPSSGCPRSTWAWSSLAIPRLARCGGFARARRRPRQTRRTGSENSGARCTPGSFWSSGPAGGGGGRDLPRQEREMRPGARDMPRGRALSSHHPGMSSDSPVQVWSMSSARSTDWTTRVPPFPPRQFSANLAVEYNTQRHFRGPCLAGARQAVHYARARSIPGACGSRVGR